jgi:hypothetical protein
VSPFLLLVSNFVKGSANIDSKWEEQLGAPVHASPLITKNRLIASNSTGKIFAFELNTGALKMGIK